MKTNCNLDIFLSFLFLLLFLPAYTRVHPKTYGRLLCLPTSSPANDGYLTAAETRRSGSAHLAKTIKVQLGGKGR